MCGRFMNIVLDDEYPAMRQLKKKMENFENNVKLEKKITYNYISVKNRSVGKQNKESQLSAVQERKKKQFLLLCLFDSSETFNMCVKMNIQ